MRGLYEEREELRQGNERDQEKEKDDQDGEDGEMEDGEISNVTIKDPEESQQGSAAGATAILSPIGSSRDAAATATTSTPKGVGGKETNSGDHMLPPGGALDAGEVPDIDETASQYSDSAFSTTSRRGRRGGKKHKRRDSSDDSGWTRSSKKKREDRGRGSEKSSTTTEQPLRQSGLVRCLERRAGQREQQPEVAPGQTAPGAQGPTGPQSVVIPHDSQGGLELVPRNNFQYIAGLLQRRRDEVGRDRRQRGAVDTDNNNNGMTLHNYAWTKKSEITEPSGSARSRVSAARMFNAQELMEGQEEEFPGVVGQVKSKGLLHFVVLCRVDREGSTWFLPATQVFHDLLCELDAAMMAENLKITEVMDWASQGAESGLIGLWTSNMTRLNDFRRRIRETRREELRFTVVPRDLVESRPNLSTILKPKLRLFPLGNLPRALFARNHGLAG